MPAFRRFIAVLFVVVALFPALANACDYWQCFNSGTSEAICDIVFCGSGRCENIWYAVSCTTACDFGSCWCVPHTFCYDI